MTDSDDPVVRQILAEIGSRELRETLKDFCGDTPFRLDVYVRGARRMSASKPARTARAVSGRMARTMPSTY